MTAARQQQRPPLAFCASCNARERAIVAGRCIVCGNPPRCRQGIAVSEVVSGRASSRQPRNRTFTLTLQGPRGNLVGLADCRFDDPGRTVRRALDVFAGRTPRTWAR